MLDTSALIGLHEADPTVTRALTAVLERLDDGTAPRTHRVVLGELVTGLLTTGRADDPANPRRPVLDTATTLAIETIEAVDPEIFARLTHAGKRAMSHNDRWICAAAIRTRSTLVTQDAGMAEQLGRFFAGIDLLEACTTYVRIEYVARDTDLPGDMRVDPMSGLDRRVDEVRALLAGLAPHEAEVLATSFGLDRGAPRTHDEVARELAMSPSRVANTHKQALTNLRAARP